MTTLNIGLNNNPFELKGILKVLRQHLKDTPIDYKLDEGIYNNVVEPTLVIAYDDDYDDAIIKDLCTVMKQTCIAVKVNGVGKLIYNRSHNGERFRYKEGLFITL